MVTPDVVYATLYLAMVSYNHHDNYSFSSIALCLHSHLYCIRVYRQVVWHCYKNYQTLILSLSCSFPQNAELKLKL